MPYRSKRSTFVRTLKTLRCIFNDKQVVTLGNVHNDIHLTRHSGIMHGNNRLSLGRNRFFNQTLIDIHGLWPNVHKYNSCTPKCESIRSAHKRVTGHDNLIALFDVQQNRCHLKGMRTRRC